jgi:hypothetical protein
MLLNTLVASVGQVFSVVNHNPNGRRRDNTLPLREIASWSGGPGVFRHASASETYLSWSYYSVDDILLFLGDIFAPL